MQRLRIANYQTSASAMLQRRRTRQPKRRKLSSPPSDEITKLCGTCKVLSFNDKDVGGCEKEDFDGSKVLGFDDQDRKRRRVPYNEWVILDYHHHDDLPDLPRLAVSAEAGCHFCNFLRTAIQKDLRKRFEWSGCEVRITLLYVWYRDSRSKILNREQRLAESRRQQQAGYVIPEQILQNEALRALVANSEIFLDNEFFDSHKTFFKTEAPPGDCAAWLKLPRPTQVHALCPENVSIIREEIESCSEICFHTQDEVVSVPTRLIDLIEPQTPRLVVPADDGLRNDADGSDIKYAALSYCWGSPSDARSMLKTETSSLKSRLAGIAIGEMPRVFQDAILVCEKLSIRYLWIDALCIVQDDDMDWEQESSRMGKVYENAFVTIVPLASHTCNEGFLQRSHETLGIPFQSTIRPEICGNFYLRHVPHFIIIIVSINLLYTPNVPHFDIGDGWHFPGLRHLEVSNSTWLKRGWTFQEEGFSTKILYFGQTMLFYECPQWDRLEIEDDRYLRGRLSFKAEAWQSDTSAGYENWESVVQLFSSRKFTYAEDTFPAISSLAQRFAEASKDDYITGLWRGDLFRGLLWYVIPEAKWESFLIALNTPNPYVAPSWSWASRKSYVDFGVRQHQLPMPTEKFAQECKIIDIRVDVAHSNPFGAVRNAALSLSGKLAPLPSMLHLMPSTFRWPTWKILQGSALLGVCEFDWVTDFEESWQAPRVGMMMLLIASWGKGAHKSSSQTKKCAYGLIILPTDNANEYRRVGVFYFGKGGGFSHDSPWNNRIFRGRQVQTIRLV